MFGRGISRYPSITLTVLFYEGVRLRKRMIADKLCYYHYLDKGSP